MDKPGRLQSIGWQSRTQLSGFTFTCFSAFSRKKETCDYSPVGGVGLEACQGFLIRGACVYVVVIGAESLLSEVQ